MNTFSLEVNKVPPGFRFHPTDEELVDYYLRKKINSTPIELDVIKDVDLYKIEPWDLQELCRLGTEEEEQNDWYFFSHKDKKYPTGSRTNRATVAGFWKATGRDKAIYSSSKHDHHDQEYLVGMRKTLVFYKGRAPNGLKSDWIMHEYRLLETTDHENSTTTQEEGWVVCRVFKKRLPIMIRRANDHQREPINNMWYDHEQVSTMPHENIDSTTQNNIRASFLGNNGIYDQYPKYYGSCKRELDHHEQQLQINYHIGVLPLLEAAAAPKLHSTFSSHSMPQISNSYSINDINQADQGSIHLQPNSLQLTQLDHNNIQEYDQSQTTSFSTDHQLTADWHVIDKFVASHELLDHQGDHHVSIKQLQGDHDHQTLYPN